jgi:hypothetical protein
MKLETQIDKLSEIGLKLNEGIVIDDLLNSFSREEYESKPFNEILFVYGIEVESPPWGRFFCDRVWNFDYECIYDSGAYIEVVNHFHRLSRKQKKLEHLTDSIDFDSGVAELVYTLDGVRKSYSPKIDRDWVDSDIVSKIIDDFSTHTHSFYGIDNGQATVWCYLTKEQAHAINNIAGNPFGLKKAWWRFWN